MFNMPTSILLNISFVGLLLFTFIPLKCQPLHVQKVFENPIDAPFQHMVVDRQYTGRVYLGGENRLHQLNSDLDLQVTVETGPQEDSPNCPASGDCPAGVKKQLMSNQNKALAIFYKQSKLIVCGSLFQGSCGLRNLYNISIADPVIHEAVVANDKSSSSVIFVAPGPPNPAEDEVLYVGSTFSDPGTTLSDLATYRDDVAAVASKSLKRDKLFKVAERAINSETQIFVERSKRKFYKIDYVYGFASGNFSYFLTRQPKLATGSSRYISKLIRICQRDKSYYSYTEVPLECTGSDGTSYNLARDAIVAKPGFDLAESLGLTTDDDVLFVAFVKGEGEVAADASRDSALCVYSIKAIEQVFLENIMMCAKGDANRGLDFYKKSTVCQKTRFPPGFDVACGNEVNYPLGGELPVTQTPVLTVSNAIFTSVTATTTHQFTVVFIGTANGILKKVTIESVKADDSSKQVVGFIYQEVPLPVSAASLRYLSLDMSGEFIYAMTEQMVLKVKVQECQVYQRCGNCLEAQDPYCGWCSLKNKCIVKDQCDAGQSSSWLPYKDQQCTTITKVVPEQIQITASEYLTLTIQNLPSLDGQLTCVFSIGSRKLSTGASRNDNTLSCPTPQTNLLPAIAAGDNFIDATLSVQLGNGPEIAATNFTFYDCTTYGSCYACVDSRFPCDWCTESQQCTAAQTTEDKCRGEHIINGLARHGPSTRKGSRWCPAFMATDPQIIVPSGSQKQITVDTQNIQDFQTTFTCEFTIGVSVIKAAAKRVANSGLQCAAVDFRYFDATPNATAKFNVLWNIGKPLDNPMDIKIVMYKCSRLSSNCGLCLNVDKRFDCGWCSSKGECSIREDCAQPTDKWLDKTEMCPGPKITSFYPGSGPLQGGTYLTVEGINLGKSFQDIQNSIKINGVVCKLEQYIETTRFICITGPALHRKTQSGPIVVSIKDDPNFIASSETSFSYVDPSPESFAPTSGPMSGGTVVTIFGKHMDAGSNISATVAGIACEFLDRNATAVRCRTGTSSAVIMGAINLTFDRAAKLLFGTAQFSYIQDPAITDVVPDKGTVSGGQKITVRGDRFDIVQDPRIYLHHNGADYYGPCIVASRELVNCLTPKIPIENDPNFTLGPERPLQLEYGFTLDGVISYRNISSRVGFKPFSIYPDPEFEPFPALDSVDGKRIKYFKNDYLTINGRYIDIASTESDIRISIGVDRCNLTVMAGRALTCRPPNVQPRSINSFSNIPEVVVRVGNRDYSIGYLSYDDTNSATIPLETIIAIAVACGVFLMAILCVVIAYRRKSTRHLRQMKSLKEQIDAIEMKVASECKEAFAELQTDMTELAADMAIGIPFLSYREYVVRALFPNVVDPPALSPDLELVDPYKRPQVEKALNTFNNLLMNKSFMLVLIHTLETNKYFLSKDRVYVGSLLMLIMQERMEYLTDILKTLLAELIEKAVDRPSQPKILFRRSESIAERMLAAWYTFLMYRYLVECAGQPLFMLYWAIKQQVEKGPQDALTHEARYSLSEEKLFRQGIGFQPMTIYVSGITGNTGQETPIRVLDCDTITQVKEKCLDAIYKTTAYSRRPTANDLELEWRTGVSGRLILQDLDMTTKSEAGDWRKLNTLAHYKVSNNASLALVPKQTSMFNLSILSERSDKSAKSFSTFSLKHSPTLTRTLQNNKDKSGTGHGDMSPRLYHLVKSQDQEAAVNERAGKMVSEIYLTRLLTAKGTLQKFIEDFFETIFSTAHRGTPLPICIKYMFDFMDEQALYHGIVDPEVPHTWKSNSLPLRFWVNLIKNPNFLFDIMKPAKIEGCLSVVAQTLMDSCSTKDHPLTKDSPSSKLLFAKDILVYREWVDRYYEDIRTMPSISDQDMNAFLADESRQHHGEFDIYPALHELYTKYVESRKTEILEALQADDFTRKNRLDQRFQQMLKIMEGESLA